MAFMYVWPGKLLVQACFPDLGANANRQGRGEFVNVSVEEVTVVHLRSQAGQPYGSVRLCCNMCGTALLGDAPKWVEYESDYESLPAGHVRCVDVEPSVPTVGR